MKLLKPINEWGGDPVVHFSVLQSSILQASLILTGYLSILHKETKAAIPW